MVNFYVTTPHHIPEDSNLHVLILFCHMIKNNTCGYHTFIYEILLLIIHEY